MDDDCEIIETVPSSENKRKRKLKDEVKVEPPKVPVQIMENLLEKLRSEVLSRESYWFRKSIFLTAEADQKIPLVKLKILELETGIHYQAVDEIVSAMKYLYLNCKGDDTFRTCVEQLNSIIEENRGSPFAIELMSKVEPNIFLQPLLSSARTPISKLQALITLAKTVGIKQVARKIFDLYAEIRIKKVSNEFQVDGLDLLWFHLHSLLCDGNLSGLEVDNALIIYQAMLKCCAVDACSDDLKEDFFAASDQLGFSRIRPRDNWRSCLKLLVEILNCRNSSKSTPLIQLLKNQIDSLSFLQISQKLIETFDVKEDEEIAKFLLTYATAMKGFYEGKNHVVFMPARIFDISKRSVKNYWIHNTGARTESDYDLDFKELADNKDQYLEVLNVAKNVYATYSSQEDDNKIEYNLRVLIQKIPLSNAFSVIGQSILLSGKYSDADKFISLAIRTTKDKNEQTILMLQLLEANVAMRRTKKTLTYALDLLNELSNLEKTVEEPIEILQTRRFEDDSFIQIPTNSIYHYVTLLLMNSATLCFTKWQVKGQKEIMNLAATVIILCVQCSWTFAADSLKNVFELLDEEISILNAIKMISNRVLFTKLLDTRVGFMEGSNILKHSEVLERFRAERANKKINRHTAFNDLVLYITSHNIGNGGSIMQILFS